MKQIILKDSILNCCRRTSKSAGCISSKQHQNNPHSFYDFEWEVYFLCKEESDQQLPPRRPSVKQPQSNQKHIESTII